MRTSEPSETRTARRDLTTLAVLALIGATTVTLLATLAAYSAPDAHPASIVTPGDRGPSRAVFLTDFPDHELQDYTGHDGQQFYAIARQPMHLEQVAPDLDRPHYRLQRIALPALVWAAHPFGGGTGLVVATVIVGLVALAAGAVAAGALSVKLGGPVWMAAVFCVLPGAFTTLRISAADTLALAAALGAIALSLHGRHRAAVALGILAVLAKESSWLLLLGIALWRRDRHGLRLAVIPAATAAAWAAVLRLTVTDESVGINEFVLPFAGIAASLELWLVGDQLLAAVSVLGAFALGATALLRIGTGHPLFIAIAIQMAFLPWLNINVLGLDYNGTRMTMPLLVLSVTALLADERRRAQAAQPAPTC